MVNIKAINGYQIRRFSEGRRCGIFVIFKMDGEFFAQSFKYCNVSEEKIAQIKVKLNDYTNTNKNCNEICSMITLTTFLNAIETIVFDR